HRGCDREGRHAQHLAVGHLSAPTAGGAPRPPTRASRLHRSAQPVPRARVAPSRRRSLSSFPMLTPLTEALILLAGSVFLVALTRRLSLPTSIAYLVLGVALGPHAIGVLSDSGTTRLLAELGVAFLLFTLGLEFSLPRMLAMRQIGRASCRERV